MKARSSDSDKPLRSVGRNEKGCFAEQNLSRRYFEQAESFSLVLDSKGRVLMANRRARSLFPERGDLRGSHWCTLFVRPNQRKLVRDAFTGFLERAAGQLKLECETPAGESGVRCIAWRHCFSEEGGSGQPVVFASGEDITEQRRADAALDRALEASAGTADQRSFDHFVQLVSRWLGADGVFIGTLTEQGRAVRSISFHLDGKISRGIEYNLEGTPSGKLLREEFLFVPDTVCRHYPQAVNLRQQEAESYVGIQLRGGCGEAIGLLAAFSRHRMQLPPHARELLQVIAARLAADLERRQAQVNMFQSDQRFRELFLNAPIAYQSLDRRGRILDVNQAWLDLLGYRREEVVGRPYVDLLPSQARRSFPCSFNNFKRFRQIRGQEMQLQRKDGRRLLVLVDGNVARDNQDRFIRTYCILTDITHRRHAENALEEERHKLARNLEYEKVVSSAASQLNSSDSFQDTTDEILLVLGDKLELDSAGFYRFDDGEGAAVRMNLWARVETALKKLLPENIPLGRYERIFSRMMRGRELVVDNLAELPPDNRHEFAVFGGAAIFICPLVISEWTKGFLVFLRRHPRSWTKAELNVLRTIADLIVGAWERHSHFQALLESERKRVDAVRLAEEAARLASIGVLAAGITHEINQPLNAIKITTDSILLWDQMNRGLLPDEFSDWLKSIPEHVNRIVDIIQQMRSYWVPADKVVARRINLNESVRKALSLVDTQLYNHGITLEVHLAPGELVLLGNPTHLEQVLINLVVNAMQALDTQDKKDKCIRVVTRRRLSRITLKVEDNGPGLKPGSFEKIFDPFYSTKRQGVGSGLGLAIVKRFVLEHKGGIAAANRDEGGAVFTVSLPAVVYEEMVNEHSSC